MKKMRLLLLILIPLLFLFPLISGKIIINQQPEKIYNLGDVISFPIKIVSSGGNLGSLNINLICGAQKVNYKTGIPSLSAGEEYETNIYVPLTKEEIGELKESCKIKVDLGGDFVFTNNFKISNLILINTDFSVLEFNPGEIISIEGQAIKENDNPVKGFIELSIIEGANPILNHLETVENGIFSINASLPKNIRAGVLTLKLDVYEVDFNGNTANKGFLNKNIRINQIPTNLELVFESKNVEPGTNLKVKSILHDQTGEKISSITSITIKNKNNKIVEQTEIATDEFFEFPILYKEVPSKWKIISSSNELTSESLFTILEKESINIGIINRTLTITNTGNIIYDKNATIKMGNETLHIELYLDIDESQKYLLTAPDGKYKIQITTDDASFLGEAILTGRAIDVKKARKTVGSIIRYPLVWIFIILLLGFIVFITFKKGYQKTFIGRISSKIKKGGNKTSLIPLKKGSLINSRNKAELSLSIKGDKQNVSVVSLNIKNLKEIQTKKGNMEETLQKIVDFCEEEKAVTYDSGNNLFFIIAPTKTRTFRNEKTALKIANKIKDILKSYNKMAKQKINFGISLNQGTIVAKQDKDSFKFMSLGTLITTAKKISSIAEEDILLSEKMNDALGSNIKTKKQEKSGIEVYSIKEIRNIEEHKKFINTFLNRMEKEKKEKKK